MDSHARSCPAIAALALVGCATVTVPDLSLSLVSSRPSLADSQRREVEVRASLRTSGASVRRERPSAFVPARQSVVLARATPTDECAAAWTCAYERLAIVRTVAWLERSEP